MPLSKAEQALQKYFRRMLEVHSASGATSEMPYYGALEELINGLGKAMRPVIICNSQLKDIGAGRPDFGLFSEKQCSRTRKERPSAERPDYGVGEIKPLSNDIQETETGDQVAKYLDKYGSVLLTNLRQFKFIKLAEGNEGRETEQYALAGSEDAFWKLAKKHQASAKKHGDEMAKLFIRSISPGRINRPEELAERLALNAQDALKALGGRDAEIPSMLRSALEESTGMKFKKNKTDNHFLRSTLVQTVFYGIFSAWVLCMRAGPQNSFHWREVGDWLKIPAITALFDEIAKTANLEKLRIKKSLDRAIDDLDCIDREVFFKNFSDEMVIQYFYEPFLKRFDRKLQKEMGVWYTPREIVKYMVTRVDRVLEEELGIEDGLANKRVQVLDPCCGTGAFIIEVLKKIEERLLAKSPDALVGQDIKEAARERIFGFELLPAPFIIAHWQVANLLANHVKGRPALEEKERPAIYLTNALTGWEEGKGKEMDYLFDELKDEKEKADEVKRDKKILVVIGNPPYDAFAKTNEGEDSALLKSYTEGLYEKWDIGRHSLQDLYVRFFRIAEKRIQKTGRGIVSYISNYSWTEEPSFVVMRQKLLQTFDKLWIEDMHGNVRKGEKAPDGKTSESIFKVSEYSGGIRQGVTISLAVKKEGGGGAQQGQVLYRDDIDNARASDRRKALLESLNASDFDGNYETAKPDEVNWFSLRPLEISRRYRQWPKLNELVSVKPFNGMLEKRGGGLFNIDRRVLEHNMKEYFDPDLSWQDFQDLHPQLAEDKSHYKAQEVRANALASSEYDPENIFEYLFHPFDVRHAYYSDIKSLWNSRRPKLWQQRSCPNKFLVTRWKRVVVDEGLPMLYSSCIGDNDAQSGHSHYIPFIHVSDSTLSASRKPNLSKQSIAYLQSIGEEPNSQEAADKLFHHILAIACSPRYLEENKDGVGIDWIRVPLPASSEDFNQSAEIGRQVADLLDVSHDPKGEAGVLIGRLAGIASIRSDNLEVSSSWGSSSGGKVRPGKGMIKTLAWKDDQRKVLEGASAAAGLSASRGIELLGEAVDVCLNTTTYWRGVPQKAWECRMGGHQILKKWLSYRAKGVLGRALRKEEARKFTRMAERISALILMQNALDANYDRAAKKTDAWPPKARD